MKNGNWIKKSNIAKGRNSRHEIDLTREEEARERARQRISEKASETDILRAETALQRAIARIEVLK